MKITILVLMLLMSNIALADDEPGGWVEPGGYDPAAEERKQKAIEAKQRAAEELKARQAKLERDRANKKFREKNAELEKATLLPANMAKVSDDDVCVKAGNEARTKKSDHWAKEVTRRAMKFNADEALQKTITIGTTECGVYASLGKPKDMHRSVGKNYIRKQLIYSGSYIYTDNGVVTSWQD